MKKVILTSIILFFTTNLFSQTFVNPIDFTENEENEKRVITYIRYQVKKDYSAIGMGDPSTLRMMERENLNAFKELTKVSNISLLRNVIKTYCEIGMCNYTTILMMYKEQNKADKSSLDW